jgi:dUTP pyrophosphatase
MEFPEGWGGIIKDRSSMAAKRVYTSAGVIDAGYRGEIIVLLRDDNSSEYVIKGGDKIAQIVPLKSIECIVEEAEDLSTTSRSDGGFGSTGS